MEQVHKPEGHVRMGCWASAYGAAARVSSHSRHLQEWESERHEAFLETVCSLGLTLAAAELPRTNEARN
jgi:hypothetical protein